MNIKAIVKKISKDRQFIAIWVLFIIFIIATTIITLLQLRPSDLNVAVRYTAYGPTHIYNDAWYYLSSFLLFLIGLGVLHSLIAIKLYDQKGPGFAKYFISLSLIVVLIASFFINYVMFQAALSS